MGEKPGVKPGSKMPKTPESESEQLAYYKALHFLRESSRDEDEANDTLITVYRRQCELINEIRPFASWQEVGRILGITSTMARTRYRNYANEVRRFEDDGNED